MAMEDIRKHYSSIRRVLILVLALNWLVAAAKIIFGLLSRCSSMTADGFHSLSDGASNIIGLIGISFACQPSDSDHPYGHKKYETFCSLGIAMLLFFVSFNLLKEGVLRFFHPVKPNVDLRSFLVMLVTLALNFWVVRYEHNKGKALQSDILISDAMHTKADIFTSFSVIIALIAIKIGYPILDPIATGVIALFIAHAALDITREGSRVLCDTAVIMEVKKISDIVLGVEGVKTCHKIRTRGRPDDIYIDLHVQISPNMHIDQAHKISYAIEERLKEALPQVTDVVVHLEPQEKFPKYRAK